jgi:hypothetical protein
VDESNKEPDVLRPEDHAYRYQLFAGSSRDLTTKTSLWRYMTFEKFCWLVEKSRLYHTRLDQFDDPFESAVTWRYAHERDTLNLKFGENYRKGTRWMAKSGRFTHFATCWHASEYESDAQWRIYAPGGAGIAIVSTMERMRRSVDLHPYVHGIMGQVEYIDFETHDMRLRDLHMRAGFVKRKSFEHEREVRGMILADLIVDGPTFMCNEESLEEQRLRQPLGVNAMVDLPGLIQSIVISPTAATYVEELVRIVTKRHGLDHLVRKSELLKSPVY